VWAKVCLSAPKVSAATLRENGGLSSTGAEPGGAGNTAGAEQTFRVAQYVLEAISLLEAIARFELAAVHLGLVWIDSGIAIRPA